MKSKEEKLKIKAWKKYWMPITDILNEDTEIERRFAKSILQDEKEERLKKKEKSMLKDKKESNSN